MKRRLHSCSFRPIAALWALALAFGASVSGADLVTERWRVPMRVDRQNVASSMVLEFDSEPLNVDIGSFGPGQSEEQAVMSDFVSALTQSDIDRALDLTAVVPGTARGDAESLLAAFSGMFSEAGGLTRFERIVHVGPDRLLIWSLPVNDETRFYRSFRFVRDGDVGYRYEGVATEPLASVLTNAFQVGQSLGPVEAAPTDYEYEYVYPGTEEQPVRFRFNGAELDVDAFNPLGETGLAPVDFFNRAMRSLATEGPAEAASYYSSYSAGRYVDWAADQGDEAYASYKADMTRYGARVVFMLDADPMYLLFYLPTNVDVKGSPLKYASVYDDPQNGLRLTSFYVQGLTDTLLQRREYFEEPFLRPQLASRGVISGAPERETVVVSSGPSEAPDPNQLFIEAGMNPFSDPDALPKDAAGQAPAAKNRDWVWYVGLVLLALLVALAIKRNNS